MEKQLDPIAQRRVDAGVCRHCGGPVPCWSPFGDVRVGERHRDEPRKKKRQTK